MSRPGPSGRSAPAGRVAHHVRRRAATASSSVGGGASAVTKRPPLVPTFLVGFLVAVTLRSTGIIPSSALGGIGHTTIYDLIKRHELVKVNIGRRGFVTSESLAAYVDRLSEAASA